MADAGARETGAGGRGGRSLGREAWLRLRQDRPAMASLAVLVAVVVGCIAGPPLLRIDADRQRPWVGAMPPLATVVDGLQENRLRHGTPAELPPAALAGQRLELSWQERSWEEYRVNVRRNTIDRIQRVVGAESVPQLTLPATGALLLDSEGEPDRDLPALSIVPGQAPPAQLGSGRVFYLRVDTGTTTHHAVARLENGIVVALERDGVAVEEVSVRGDDLLALAADDRPLTLTHLLGADHLGRDLLARILHGGRISLLVGLVATIVSLAIGVVYGAVSGYAGGRVDRLMMAAVDVLYAIPFMFLVILLLVFFGRNIVVLFVALGCVQWLTMARIVRGQVLSLRQREFISAAVLSGATPWAVLWRHLLPNCMGPVVVYTTLTVPAVILQESFLAFIGLQVQFQGSNLDSWGALVQQGMENLDREHGDRWWLLVFPSLAMAVTLLALNILGDGLRDALDPRLRGSGP